MRGSVQFTNHDAEVKAGLCALAFMIIVVAGLMMTVGVPGSLGDNEEIRLNVEGLESFRSHAGSVYLLDLEGGNITNVGRFELGGPGGDSMTLTMPDGKFDSSRGLKALYWRDSYETYGPYFNFINDVDLRERLSARMREAFADAEVKAEFKELLEATGPVVFKRAQPHFMELKDDPEVRNAFIDLGLEQLVRWLSEKNGGIESVYPEQENAGSTGKLSSLLGEKAAEWPWGEWFGEVFSDPEIQAKFPKLMDSMEPYFRASINELLWNPASLGEGKIANVRLLWVARRALFGGREAAITLMYSSDTDRPEPVAKDVIQVKEAL